MNLFTLISFAIAALVFGYSVAHSGVDMKNLLDVHGIMIVLGGTVACTAIAYQINRIIALIKVFFDRMIRSNKVKYRDTIRALMELAEVNRMAPAKLAEAVKKQKDPFLREAMEMYIEGAYDIDRTLSILRRRVTSLYQRYSADAKVFQSMGKFPPAMGLMGAVLGMIALLGSLGKPGAEKGVGPAMSIALIATFYGIALANLIIIPIGENLMEGAKETKLKNQMIVEGIQLISEKTNPILLAEELNSFLLPSERISLKDIKKAA